MVFCDIWQQHDGQRARLPKDGLLGEDGSACFSVSDASKGLHIDALKNG